jgi:hypothetical protein
MHKASHQLPVAHCTDRIFSALIPTLVDATGSVLLTRSNMIVLRIASRKAVIQLRRSHHAQESSRFIMRRVCAKDILQALLGTLNAIRKSSQNRGWLVTEGTRYEQSKTRFRQTKVAPKSSDNLLYSFSPNTPMFVPEVDSPW